MNYLSDGGIFVVQTLTGLIVLALNLRFLMQVSRANYYNPIAQGLVKATNPLIAPFRGVLPILGRVDLANMMAALVCQAIGIILIMWVATGIAFAPVYLLWSVVAIIASVLNLYFFALLILVISSWLAPYSANPALELVREITEPICAPVRQVIPAVGGLDFSIIVIFIGLSLLENNLLVRPLAAFLNMPRGLVFGF
ncbi:MAG: YggT family protein [Gammaproteobacteria bacterium]|nr:YggT family protein [Gammaproteobacteria bacterium]